MFWNDDANKDAVYEVPDDIVDVNFKIKCPQLPLDHAYALSQAILQQLPWIEDDDRAGIHLIHGAESGNGWIRPSDPDELLYPSRRTLFTIRTPKEHIDDVKSLDGNSIQLCDVSLEFSKPTIRKLSKLTTIFARYILADHVEDETAFLNEAMQLLAAKKYPPTKNDEWARNMLTLPRQNLKCKKSND